MSEQLSLFSTSLPQSVLSAVRWSVARPGVCFVVALPSPVPPAVGAWLLASGCVPRGSALVPGGVAFLLAVPPALAPAFSKLPSARGGSRHPSNYLPF